MNVAIIVPVLRRPERLEPVLKSIAAATPRGSWWAYIITSPGDSTYDTTPISRLLLPVIWIVMEADFEGNADYSRKINRGYRDSDEPLIFTGADDLEFRSGWLEAAKAKLAPGIGVVGTNDLGNPRVMRGEHSTHSLVTREYADHGGSVDQSHMIYSEAYPHMFCDTELVETAKARGAFAFAADSVVAHMHPAWGKGETDELYEKHSGREAFRAGKKIYDQRRKLWEKL